MARTVLLVLAAALATPAHADLIARVPTPLGEIEMDDSRGEVCLAAARMAVWVGGDGSETGDCWRPAGGMVGIVFFDGDVRLIPPDAMSGISAPAVSGSPADDPPLRRAAFNGALPLPSRPACALPRAAAAR